MNFASERIASLGMVSKVAIAWLDNSYLCVTSLMGMSYKKPLSESSWRESLRSSEGVFEKKVCLDFFERAKTF